MDRNEGKLWCQELQQTTLSVEQLALDIYGHE